MKKIIMMAVAAFMATAANAQFEKGTWSLPLLPLLLL